MRRQGACVIQGDADTDCRISRRRVRLRHPVADAAGDAPSRVVLEAHAAHRPARRRVVSQFRSLGHPAAAPVRRPHATNRQSALCVVGSPNIHFCTIKDFRQLCDVVGVKMERAVALNAWGRALRFKRAVVVLEPVRRAGGIPLSRRR